MGKIIMRIVEAAAAGCVAATWAGSAMAYPAMPAPLQGRTVTGAPVSATDPAAVMEYDPNLNVTWLRDWNVNGAKSWEEQLVWAGSLHVGAFANWSLPTAFNQDGSGPCYGLVCTGGQMAYLWYVELGNTAYSFANAGPFQNVQVDSAYWSSTEFAPDLKGAWSFNISAGSQYYAWKSYPLPAVAIRLGDVATAVPELQTLAMMLAGLSTMMLFRRK